MKKTPYTEKENATLDRETLENIADCLARLLIIFAIDGKDRTFEYLFSGKVMNKMEIMKVIISAQMEVELALSEIALKGGKSSI